MHVINKIMTVSDITKEDLVIEVGPGIGGLTQALAERAGKVITIEIDKGLIPILNNTLSGYDNIEIINEDVLKVNIHELISSSGYTSIKMVSNLPYYITTPIIMRFLEYGKSVKSLTVMMQKEVAERIKAKPSTKAYGSLSLAVQYHAKISLGANVPQNCFMPRPNVDSAVLHLEILDTPKVKAENEELMFKIIKFAFAQRRKTLVNSLFNMGGLELSKEKLVDALQSIGLNEKIRGEALSLEEYAMLSDIIGKIKD